jgi:CubicO group peptidase (beta-lactamase class C family)
MLLAETRRALMHRVAVGQAEGRVPSLTGAVLREGHLVWCGSRGMGELAGPETDTQYRIGSLTKMFTAVMVMRLRDEGLLDLADPLGKHLDAGPAAVTIAQLLSHMSGLASEARDPWWERTPGELRPELADIFGEQPQRHPAGRRFHYSSPGYALLGALVGRLRGGQWHEILQQEVLLPLGMTRTTVLAQPPHERGWAVHPWADVIQPEPAVYTGHMAPSADLWSTAADLGRFAAFLAEGDSRILADETLAEMRAPASPPEGDAGEFGYGLGIQLFRRDGRMLSGHLGSMPGFLAALWISPAERLGGIALANATSGVDINTTAGDLIKIVADREPPMPRCWKPQQEVNQALLGLTGLWYWGPRPFILRLLTDGGLELSAPNAIGHGARLRADGEDTWTGVAGYYAGEPLRVVRGADGSVDHLNLGAFVFTREPYDQDAPPAARPDPGGWRTSSITT